MNNLNPVYININELTKNLRLKDSEIFSETIHVELSKVLVKKFYFNLYRSLHLHIKKTAD